MKYAVINQRGGVSRISDTEPKAIAENATVVEITDEDAALVQAGRAAFPKIHYRWVNNSLMLLKDALSVKQLLALPLEEVKATKITELSTAARLESESDIAVDGVGLLHVDAKTILQLTTIEALIADGTHLALVAGEYPNYKCVDGSFVNLTAANMAAIRTAIMDRDLNIYSVKLKGMVDAIAAATTVEELDAITW